MSRRTLKDDIAVRAASRPTMAKLAERGPHDLVNFAQIASDVPADFVPRNRAERRMVKKLKPGKP